ncbi:MAG: helix-turn-helix domain-containing protein [Methylovirgula sp.]
MPGPQIIVTPNGEELVVLPRADYDALIEAAAAAEEDASDIEIYDARKDDLAAGRNFVLPPEVSAAMLRGDTLLKALRKWRGKSQIELAAATGLGQGYLSDLEGGRRRGTQETIEKIASALEIDAEWLQ